MSRSGNCQGSTSSHLTRQQSDASAPRRRRDRSGAPRLVFADPTSPLNSSPDCEAPLRVPQCGGQLPCHSPAEERGKPRLLPPLSPLPFSGVFGAVRRSDSGYKPAGRHIEQLTLFQRAGPEDRRFGLLCGCSVSPRLRESCRRLDSRRKSRYQTLSKRSIIFVTENFLS